MKVHLSTVTFALLACLVLTTGCETPTTTTVEKVGDAEPFATLAAAPLEQWWPEAFAVMEGTSDKILSEKGVRKIFPGIDIEKPCAASVYMSEKLIPEPVLYLPVRNYDRFVTHLKLKFQLKQAAASKFRFGPFKLYVKQRGEFAVIGTSITGINHSPAFPQSAVDAIPNGHDLAFNLKTKTLSRGEKKYIAKAIKTSLSKQFSELVETNESFTFGLKFNSTKEMKLLTAIKPAPRNAKELADAIGVFFKSQKIESSVDVDNHCVACNFTMPATQFAKAWDDVEGAVGEAFKPHLTAMRKRALHQDASKINMKVSYENGCSPGYNSATISGGGGGGGRRS